MPFSNQLWNAQAMSTTVLATSRLVEVSKCRSSCVLCHVSLAFLLHLCHFSPEVCNRLLEGKIFSCFPRSVGN
jgi:hypothetical protein